MGVARCAPRTRGGDRQQRRAVGGSLAVPSGPSMCGDSGSDSLSSIELYLRITAPVWPLDHRSINPVA